MTSPAQGGHQLVAAYAAPLGADAAPPGANTAQAVRGCAISGQAASYWLRATFANMANYR